MNTDQAESWFGTKSSVIAQRFGPELQTAKERFAALRLRVPTVLNAPRTLIDDALHEIESAHEELCAMQDDLSTHSENLALSQAALDVERRRYQELFEALPEACIVTDQQGVVLESNRRAAALLNLDARFLLGKPLGLFANEEGRHQLRCAMQELCDRSDPVVLEVRLQPRQSRSSLRVSATASRSTGTSGQAGALRWIFSDVPSRHRDSDERPVREVRTSELEEMVRARTADLLASKRHVEQHLAFEQEARRAAERALAQKEALLNMVAHELRTPLNSVLGWAELLRGGLSEDRSCERALNALIRATKALARLVQDLVDSTYAARGMLRLQLADTELGELVRQVADEHRPAADAKRIAFEVSVPLGNLRACVDPLRIAQVISNLLGNALKFTRSGGQIRLELSGEREWVVLTVRDNGRGIAMEQLNDLFHGSARARERPTDPLHGMGLGLSLARTLVEQHGGHIHASSAGEGKGSTFTVRLPRTADQSGLREVSMVVVSSAD